jgi:hypothetical protein
MQTFIVNPKIHEFLSWVETWTRYVRDVSDFSKFRKLLGFHDSAYLKREHRSAVALGLFLAIYRTHRSISPSSSVGIIGCHIGCTLHHPCSST